MILKFELTMPKCGSWNIKWTGEDDFYAIVRVLRGKKQIENAKRILEKGYFHYDFGDGWAARISVEKIDSSEAAKVRRKSKGFCGYDWMVESIIKNGQIITG